MAQPLSLHLLGILHGLVTIESCCPSISGGSRGLWRGKYGAGTFLPRHSVRYKLAEGEGGFIHCPPSGTGPSKGSKVWCISSVVP